MENKAICRYCNCLERKLLYKFSDIKSFFRFHIQLLHKMKIEVLCWGGIQCIMTSLNYKLFIIQFSWRSAVRKPIAWTRGSQWHIFTVSMLFYFSIQLKCLHSVADISNRIDDGHRYSWLDLLVSVVYTYLIQKQPSCKKSVWPPRRPLWKKMWNPRWRPRMAVMVG